MPIFQGSEEPGVFVGDIADIDPNYDLFVVLEFFFAQDMFNNKMPTSTKSFDQLYVKKWQPVSGNEIQAFFGLIIHMGLINYTGERLKLSANTWKKGNVLF